MNTIMLGVGGLEVSNKKDSIIKTMALGSCVGVVMISPCYKIAGMAHVALPDSNLDKKKAEIMPGYFADSAINELANKLKKYGISNGKVQVKIFGGAKVMGSNNFFNIGKRNILSVRKFLWKHGLYPKIEDVGGTISRTIWVETNSGKVYVSSPGRSIKVL